MEVNITNLARREPEEPKRKSGKLSRFIRPMLGVEGEALAGSVPRVCEVEGRLCKWTHTKKE